MKRVKYVSRFREPLEEAEIQEIAVKAEANNMKLGITGLLVTTGSLFFQILEGPAASVDATWEMIEKDDRHTDVLLLSSEDGVTERLFPDWAMKTLSLAESKTLRLQPVHELIRTVFVQRQLIDSLVRTIERSVWDEVMHESDRSGEET